MESLSVQDLQLHSDPRSIDTCPSLPLDLAAVRQIKIQEIGIEFGSMSKIVILPMARR